MDCVKVIEIELKGKDRLKCDHCHFDLDNGMTVFVVDAPCMRPRVLCTECKSKYLSDYNFLAEVV